MARHVGQRLSVRGELGTIRYIGSIQGKPGTFIGIEWDLPDRGKHDGSHEGKRYFTCRSRSDKCASFLKSSTPSNPPQTLHTAVERKYAAGEIDFPGTISFSSKVVEEKGYDKISTRQSKLDELKNVVIDNQCLTGPSDDAETPLKSICPNATSLDIGYNLFESLSEIGNIVEGCQALTSLSLECNRLGHYTDRRTFPQVSSLSLEGMMLLPADLRTMMQAFPNAVELNISRNMLNESLDSCIPTNIRALDLSDNGIDDLKVVQTVARSCQKLERLLLKHNSIGKNQSNIIINKADPEARPSLTEVDMSNNMIANISLVDTLPCIVPGLRHLRISNNPIYSSSKRPNGTPLTPTEVSLLIIARLPELASLNFTAVKAKDRLDAEAFYLSLIAEELSLSPASRHAEIIARHPRYKALCEDYGIPSVQAQEREVCGHPHPNSIAARLVRCHIYFSVLRPASLGGLHLPTKEAKDTLEIPLSFSMYAMTAHVARHYGLLASALQLVWETGERDPVAASIAAGAEIEEWDSEEEEDDHTGEWVEREEVLNVGTRVLGSLVDSREMTLRVEFRDGMKGEQVRADSFLESKILLSV
ncbi:hypothetical protein KVT40_005185 [Elsinoe batatas]|uniref:CAP-Gly domain-containing protein n=1 Tax=Elsinoe batatas TaxID=2601811 RepID=A0A8K0KZN7_9PEZI|nr:hypothetical protein KVT40_005185 [Elsinoe batatas]